MTEPLIRPGGYVADEPIVPNNKFWRNANTFERYIEEVHAILERGGLT